MKRIPIATEPLRWTHPQIGTIHLYPEGSGWAVDINGIRAWTFMGNYRRQEVEAAVKTRIDNWSYLETFRKAQRYFDQTTTDRDLEVLKKDLGQ